MPTLSQQEARLFNALRQAGQGVAARAAVAELHKKARHASADGLFERAALSYAALAQSNPNDQNLPLRAARNYHKAERSDDAARWYLETAERYARQHRVTQAIATLRLFREVAPDDHLSPKRIFQLCHEKGATASGMYELLSPKEQAAQSLRVEDLFSVFDNETFDTALDHMISRRLDKGELLTRTGEVASSIFIIVRGSVDGFLTLNKRRTHLGSIGNGDICGAIPYFTGKRSTSEIIASETTDLLELPYHILDLLKERCPEFGRQLEDIYRGHILTTQLALAPVFSKLDAQTRLHIAKQMQMIRLAAGELLFSEDDSSCDVFLVRSGAISLNLAIDDQERQFKTMYTGAVIGEIHVATRNRRTASARAISDCNLARLAGDEYQALYQQSERLQNVLERRKKEQAAETREFIRQLTLIEGDDTCQLLLRDIWGRH